MSTWVLSSGSVGAFDRPRADPDPEQAPEADRVVRHRLALPRRPRPQAQHRDGPSQSMAQIPNLHHVPPFSFSSSHRERVSHLDRLARFRLFPPSGKGNPPSVGPGKFRLPARTTSGYGRHVGGRGCESRRAPGISVPCRGVARRGRLAPTAAPYSLPRGAPGARRASGNDPVDPGHREGDAHRLEPRGVAPTEDRLRSVLPGLLTPQHFDAQAPATPEVVALTASSALAGIPLPYSRNDSRARELSRSRAPGVGGVADGRRYHDPPHAVAPKQPDRCLPRGAAPRGLSPGPPPRFREPR